MDREKIIEGLKKVLNDIVDGYITEPDMACNTINDAIDLLKVQEPRLLTCADFESNPMLDDDGRLPCWCEDLICGSGWTAVSVGGVLPDHIKANGCRYWTSRPSDEQQKAVKWP